MIQPDPLSDTLEALLRLGLDEAICRRAISEIRRRWGGGVAYIRAVDREAREAVIRHGLENGDPVREIARRAEVHPATVRRKRSGWL